MTDNKKTVKAVTMWSSHFLMGGIAGAVAKTTVAPLERLRLLKQTGGSVGSTMDTFHSITGKEGVLGLWRGNLINVLRIIPSRGVLFASNDLYKGLFKDRFPATDDPDRTPFWMLFSSGGLAGMTAIFATYPLDVARTRIAGRIVTEGPAWSPKAASMTLCLADMLKHEGLRSWYRGIGPTLLGALPYEGIKFSVFGYLTKNVLNSGSAVDKLLSGAAAGCAAGFVMFPNDTVRKLLQMRQPIDGDAPYTSAWNCWKRTFLSSGVKRLYRGLTPYILRIGPSSAIQFYVYESLKTAMNS